VLTYSASNLPAGATFNVGTRTFSWRPDYTQAGDYSVTFRVSDGSLEDSETITIHVNDVDDGRPQYSGLFENPNEPISYVPNQKYEFGIIWADADGIANVWFVLNGANYTPINNGSNYTFVINDLGVGVYAYEWHAVDTLGNSNSVAGTYTINKAVPNLSISMSPSDSVKEGTTTTVTGEGCPAGLTCILYRNGVEVTNPDVNELSKGDYDYAYSTDGNENYTSANLTRRLVVFKEGDRSENGGSRRKEVYDIDDNSLNNGYSRWVYVGDMLRFKLCDETYTIKLNELTSTKATIKISPNLITESLKEGSSNSYDLQGDAIKDIIVKIEDINYGSKKAKVFVMKLGTSVCKITKTSETKSDNLLLLNEKSVTKKEMPLWEYLLLGLAAGIVLEIIIVIIKAITLAIAGKKKTRIAQKTLPSANASVKR